jgi:hypothetical protein
MELLRLFCALLFGLAAAVPAVGDAVPADFRISLRSAATRPGAPVGPQAVTIDAKGKAHLSAVKRPGDDRPALDVTLAPDALRRIYDAAVRERFFDLEPRYEDPDVLDGDYAEIEVRAGGRTHTVRTVNIRVHAFDRIAVTIDRELPKGRRIQYNALHTDSYRAVER